MLRRFLVAFVLLFAPPAMAEDAPAFELIMFEEAGCIWCARWHAELGSIYPKTNEGQTAPLRQVDLGDPWPEDLSEINRVVFTPTFVLVRDGVELDRIEGYPGEDFFWWMLSEMLKKQADTPLQEAG